MVADVANIQKSYFEVLGLCCASEVPLVEKIIKSLNGVKEVSVIVPTRTVIVVHDNNFVSRNQIVEELNQARLEANVRPDGEVKFRKKWPGPGTLACGSLLALSFLKYVYSPMKWLALIAVVIGLPSIIWRSISALRNLSPNINILVLISVGGTLALQDYWEAASIVFLFNIAQWLESRASHKAMAVMSSLMSMAPQKAIIAETGREVDVNNVMVNTVLAVRSGDAIPIDGVVVGGTCEVDEKMLTGESFPVTKQLESTVYAGTINLDGYITVKTTVLAEDCVVARMVKLVEEAHNKKSRFQRYIDECAKYYIPAVVLVSLGVAVIPAAFGVENKTYWFHLALVVLVSTCPCALILATPVAVFCALSKLATTGMLVKGGEYLEILAKVKTVAFDKTGTITRGEFIVVEFQTTCDLVSFDKLLYWVSSIESKSSHPMATALINHGRLHSVAPKPENVDDFQNFPGEGIYGKIDGKSIYIGKKRIALRAGCKEDPTQEIQSQEDKANGYVYLGATLVGIFSLSDACRSTSLKAIEELKSLGIKTVMLTGDSHAAAVHVQHQLEYSLDVVHAELLPEDKARFIEEFKKDGPVAMVGDGINDAPALAIADIGISMGISGSALATESGNIILMSNDIQKIPKAIQLARKTHRKLTENIVLSITTKGAVLALAFAGYPLVSAAILTDVGTCLLVILNSMLLLQGTSEPGGSRSRRTSDNTVKQMSEPLQGSSERQYGTFRPDLSDDNASSCLVNEQSGCRDRSRVSQGCEDGCCKKVIEGKSPQSVDKPSGSKASNCVSCKKGKCTSSAARQGVNVDKPIGSKASNCVSCKKGNCTSSTARQGVNVEDDALNMV